MSTSKPNAAQDGVGQFVMQRIAAQGALLGSRQRKAKRVRRHVGVSEAQVMNRLWRHSRARAVSHLRKLRSIDHATERRCAVPAGGSVVSRRPPVRGQEDERASACGLRVFAYGRQRVNRLSLASRLGGRAGQWNVRVGIAACRCDAFDAQQLRNICAIHSQVDGASQVNRGGCDGRLCNAARLVAHANVAEAKRAATLFDSNADRVGLCAGAGFAKRIGHAFQQVGVARKFRRGRVQVFVKNVFVHAVARFRLSRFRFCRVRARFSSCGFFALQSCEFLRVRAWTSLCGISALRRLRFTMRKRK
ncbi:hypothetical protein [Cupriavidus basilensis]|uniref:hypothetical protein n=1 Tax=Cupriavidus basilensis TaxID=68895 RepID=UPI0011472364|nr:hypothetical protein [Cupriavidus basilensis]